MKILTIVLRVLLGLMFLIFGANGFLQFMPMPPMSGLPGDFIHAMAASGYLQAVAACQMIGGALLVAGWHVPVGLVILGPVIFNILCFHIFLERTGLGMAIGVALVASFLTWQYRSAFTGVVRT